MGNELDEVNIMKSRNRNNRLAIAGALMAMFVVGAPTAVAASESLAYVPMGTADRVAVLDLGTYRITGRVNGVVNSHGADITPDGRHVAAGSLTPREDGTMPEAPDGVSESEHEAHHGDAEPASASPGNGTLFLIDTHRQRVVRAYDVPGPIHHVEITADGRYAVSTHPAGGGISVVALDSGELKARIATGPVPNYIVESNDGASLYVSNSGNGTISEIDTDKWIVRRNLYTGGAPEHLALDEERRRIYANDVAGGRTIALDLASGDPVAEYPVGPGPHGLAIGRDNAVLYVTSREGDRLTAIDLDAGTTRGRELGPAPYHVAVNRIDGQLLVTSRELTRLWVIDPVTLAPVEEVELDGIGHQIAFTAR